MGVRWIMEDGTEVVVPPGILAQDLAAQQAFYDNQVRRVRMEQADDRKAAKKKDDDA